MNTSKQPKKAKVKPWQWSPVDPLEVLSVSKEQILLLGSERITETELKNLQMEAKTLKTFRLWRIMQETVKQKAIQMGFVDAETWERAMSGKMMLHNLGILHSIVENLTIVPVARTPLTTPRPSKHRLPTQ